MSSHQPHRRLDQVRESIRLKHFSLSTEKFSADEWCGNYSTPNSGVLAAIAASNSQLQTNLDRAMAERAIAAGCFPKDVRAAIAQHSPQAKQSAQPETYAQSIVAPSVSSTASVNSTASVRVQAQPNVKSHAPARRAKTKDSGMEL